MSRSAKKPKAKKQQEVGSKRKQKKKSKVTQRETNRINRAFDVLMNVYQDCQDEESDN